MDNFDLNKVVEKIMDRIQKEFKEMDTLNVMVLGKTGVGKSTLINNMFNERMADTGIGKPVTKEIKKITKPDFPLAIYDTPGIELGGEKDLASLLDGIKAEVSKGVKSGDIEQAIHCIWYCISTPSHRFEEAEIKFLKELFDRTVEGEVPVIIVLTKSYSKVDAEKMMSEIEKENLPIAKIVPVLAEDYDIDEEYVAKAYGLDVLSEVMNNAVPEAVKKTFVAVQKANLELKKKRAHAVVAATALTAAATGAAPIPFSDAALLVPEQISMLAGITAVFGFPVEKGTFSAILSSTIGTAGATVLGRTIASNLIKFVPGVGSVVGGIISASTASALTIALGETYIKIMEKVYEGELKVSDLSTKKGKKSMKAMFVKELKVKREKDKEVSE
ncbi:MAG: GTPase [Clostridiales bacterium]|nr:GTPase [Clostridiales bacterium]